MILNICTNCGALLGAATDCARCGQQSIPVTALLDTAPELKCANGFHYVGDSEDFCRCGEYAKSDKVGE